MQHDFNKFSIYFDHGCLVVLILCDNNLAITMSLTAGGPQATKVDAGLSQFI